MKADSSTATLTSSADIVEAIDRAATAAQLAPRTSRAYRRWIRAFAEFTVLAERDHDEAAARDFLSSLVEQTPALSVSTLEQARSALTFYFSQTSRGEDAPALELPLSVRRRRRALPTFLVCNDEDAVQIITSLRGAYQVAAWLIYEAGLSAAEAARVRVSDIDVDARSLLINRAPPPAPNLGAAAVRALQHHLYHLRQRALEISPGLTDAEWGAQYLLPTRSHLPVAPPPALWAPVTDEAIQRNIGRAFRRAGMPTDRPCTVLRNSCIWRLMDAGLEPRQIAAAIGATSTTHILRARRAKPLSRT